MTVAAMTMVAGVLAGGASRRMGGRPKALLAWPPGSSGPTFLDTVLGYVREGGIAQVAVVTGTHHASIAAACAGRTELPLLYNPRHDQGQVTSLWRLLDWADSLPEAPEWLAVTLVDLPGVQSDTISRLRLAALAAAPDTMVIRPAVGGRHGHPVFWRRAAWPRLRAASIESGARSVVHDLVDQRRVVDLEVDDQGVLRDIDTAEDYAAARSRS